LMVFATMYERNFSENLTAKLIHDLLTRYEKCFIRLEILNDSSDIYNQYACIEENDLYPPRLPFIDNPITSCYIGYSLMDGWSLGGHNISRYLDNKQQCVVRSIKERSGLRSIWKFNLSDEDMEKVYAHSLGRVFKKYNIQSIDLRGDSVMGQVAKYFACDLSRSPNVTVFSHKYLFDTGYRVRSPDRYNNYAKANIAIDGYSFDISTAVLRLPCILIEQNNPKCLSNNTAARRDFVYQNVLEYLHRTMSHASTSSSPSILIFNSGLHIHHLMAKLKGETWILEPIVKALLEVALSSFGKYFVFFRETSAQHFNSREGGLYWGNKTRHTGPGEIS